MSGQTMTTSGSRRRRWEPSSAESAGYLIAAAERIDWVAEQVAFARAAGVHVEGFSAQESRELAAVLRECAEHFAEAASRERSGT